MENKIIKVIGYVSDITKNKKEDFTLTCIGSKECIDRDHEVVKVEGINLKNYKKNPVVLLSHMYGSIPIGKAVKVWKSDNELKFKIKFNEKSKVATEVYEAYAGGYMSAFSIGFIPDYNKITYVDAKGTRKPYRILESSELMEISCVSVPANALALVTDKGFMVNKDCENKVEGEELTYLENMIKEVNESIKKEQDNEDDPVPPTSAPQIDYQKEIEDLKEEINLLKKDDYLFSLFDSYKKEVNEREDKAKYWINIIKNER